MALRCSTNVLQSACVMARRLVMLFAIISWVSARRCLDSAPDDSAVCASSPSHSSSRISGGCAPRSGRTRCNKREMNAGVSVGGAATNPATRSRSRFAPSSPASRNRSAHASASASSSRRWTVRSVIRRTLSRQPSRSIAGTAQSSPIESGETPWNA